MKKILVLLLVVCASLISCKKDKSRFFKGVVKDETTDAPLENARVVAYRGTTEDPNLGSTNFARITETISDPDGNFELDLTGEKGTVLLFAESKNYYSTDLLKYSFDEGAATNSITLQLVPQSHLKLNFMIESAAVTSANLSVILPDGNIQGITLGGGNPSNKVLLFSCKGNQHNLIKYSYSTYGASGLIASGNKEEQFYCFANDSTAYNIKF